MTGPLGAAISRSARPRQLVFDLWREPRFDPDDFLVSPANEAAVAAVRSWPEWPTRCLLLIGPPGSGKSHLAAIWAADVGATHVGSTAALQASLWNGRERHVLLEDCDKGLVAEVPFFHALNLARESEGWLLMTARTPPTAWNLTTPDLLSRLRLVTLATIEPPDAGLMMAVLVKLFADRQILVDEDVISYAARHCERCLAAAVRFVDAVDAAALADRRRITRPFAAATLAALQPDVPD